MLKRMETGNHTAGGGWVLSGPGLWVLPLDAERRRASFPQRLSLDLKQHSDSCASAKLTSFSMNHTWNLHLVSQTHWIVERIWLSSILFMNWTLRQDVSHCFGKQSEFSSPIPHRGTHTTTPRHAHSYPFALTLPLEVVYCCLFPTVTSHRCYYCTVILIFVPVTHLDRKALRTLITLWPDMELYF